MTMGEAALPTWSVAPPHHDRASRSIQGIDREDDSQAALLDYSPLRWVKIDPPDFTAPHPAPPRSRCRKCHLLSGLHATPAFWHSRTNPTPQQAPLV